MRKKITKIWNLGIYEYRYLRRRCYPEFVYNSGLKNLTDEIPVFLFHDVSAGDFERKLSYLASNGYETLNADELSSCLSGDSGDVVNKVVLTFDDGRRNLLTIAFPLLKKYGFVGISFLVSGWVKNQNDTVHQNLLTWPEIQSMHSQGFIDFQSHSFSHRMIFNSDKITDFYNPGYNCGFNLDLVPLLKKDGYEDFSEVPEYGTPIYTMSPRLFGERRYFDDENLRQYCVSYVKNNGDIDFFNRGEWKKKLFAKVVEYKEKHALNTCFETEDELRDQIRFELEQSKKTIEENLPNKSVRHLCLPYFAGSYLTIEIAKEVGYQTVHWGWDVSQFKNTTGSDIDPYGVGFQYSSFEWDYISAKRSNCVGDDPFKIVRLPSDYIYSLPGNGRKNIYQVLLSGIRKNFPSGPS